MPRILTILTFMAAFGLSAALASARRPRRRTRRPSSRAHFPTVTSICRRTRRVPSGSTRRGFSLERPTTTRRCRRAHGSPLALDARESLSDVLVSVPGAEPEARSHAGSSETPRLWNWDVAEAFIGSDFERIGFYKEFQVSPQGEWVDLAIDRDNRRRRAAWRGTPATRSRPASTPQRKRLVRRDEDSVQRDRHADARERPRASHRHLPARRSDRAEEALHLATERSAELPRAAGVRDSTLALVPEPILEYRRARERSSCPRDRGSGNPCPRTRCCED